MNGGTKTCPVCDSEIDARAERCKFCDTDLSLFEFDMEGDVGVEDIQLGEDETIDQLLADIVEGAGGKGDFLEEIKSLGKNGVAAEEGAAEEAGLVTFECPNCGAAVAEDAATCPDCGVEFAEEAAQFECPVCNTAVDPTAASCPSCGVEFATPEEVEKTMQEIPEIPEPEPDMGEAAAEVERALSFEEGEAILVTDEGEAAKPTAEVEVEPPRVEELGLVARIREARLEARDEEDRVAADVAELYNELPRLVAEVKPMLVQAKKLKVEIGDTKDLINRAIAAGKERNMREAVRLVRKSKRQLKDYFALQLAYRIESLYGDVMEAKARGGETGDAESLIKSAVALLEGEHYEEAQYELEEARESFSKVAGGYYEASEELKSVRALLNNAREFNMDLTEALSLLAKSRDALEKQEWDVALLYAKQSKDRVLRELPVRLSEEMKQARSALMDLKVQGQDLSKSIGILKRASISLKKKDYGDALRYVKMFRDEVARATGS